MNTVIKPDYLNGKEFELLRSNPDRGWRIETYITLGSNTVMFNNGFTPEEFLNRELEHYKDLNINTVQLYVYLTQYIKKPLDRKAFVQLEDYLKLLKKNNLRALLRFTYEYDVSMKIGPTSSRIFSHIEQLKQWFLENEDLVKQTVMVIQAGFLGAWGEWHSAKYPHNGKTALLKICDMTPDYLTIQVRQQKFKDKIKNSDNYNRVGYHDDYLVGVYHKWSTPKSGVSSQSFKRFVEDSLYRLNDGEMPWGKDKVYKNGYIDGIEMLQGAKLRSLTTMSITHNYTEDNSLYNAHRWQGEILSPAQLQKLSIPYFSTYFSENEEKTVFDFLTDHLGYMLAVEKIELLDNSISITIKNNGFALPFGFSEFSLFTHDGSNVREYRKDDFDFYALTAGQTAEFTFNANCKSVKAIGISLKKPIENFSSIRFANRCDFKDSINWFTL